MKNYYRLLKNHRRPIRFVIARSLMASGLSRVLTIRQDGFKLRFYPSNSTMALWIDPLERAHDRAFFKAYLRPGDVVADVGANIGEIALTASAAVGVTGRVLAFEPHPRTFKYLLGNLRLNQVQNVTPYNLGLGDASGVVGFSDDWREDMNHVEPHQSGISVRMSTVDIVLRDEATVNLLKIDVEGYERHVIAGATSVLKRTECIHFEAYDENYSRFGYKTADIVNQIASAGFTITRIVSPGILQTIDPCFEAPRCENLIAAKDLALLQSRTGWTIAKKVASIIG